MLRAFLAAGMLAAAPAGAQAHDFWIVSSDYQIASPQAVELDFLVGHGADNETWDLRWRRVVSLRSFLDGTVTDQQRGLRPLDGAAPQGQRVGASIMLEGEGTHIAAFESNHAQSELDPFAFENHLAEQGIEHAIALREAGGQSRSPGTEIYARRAKALIQVGGALSDVTRPIGQTLEIVPLENPFDGAREGDLGFQVLYRGEPLEGGLVRLRSLNVASGSALRSVRSDAAGQVRLPVPQTGAWLITVVWASALDSHPTAQFETMFASLTFGY